MQISNLWNKLSINDNRKEVFKKDVAEGKVPELPFYIIGQNILKNRIKNRIEEIDSKRMVNNLIVAEYGNGKTNLLKYLQLFFKTYSELGVNVQYSRADVERTDLVLFLLRIVQDNYLEKLVRIIVEVRNTPDIIPELVNNFDNNFREIREYCNKLFDLNNTDGNINELIYLGTGRLYNKKYFDRYGLEQLKDFNRREVLALFLNLLSYDKLYIIFAIDEIEKIREKSKIRFSHFLTSYRELLDLFNQIKGHYLITSLTEGTGSNEISTANEALYTRIREDIIPIEALNSKADIMELISYLDELFETNRKVDYSDIYSSFIKKEFVNNRVSIQEITKLLYKQVSDEPLKVLLENNNLSELYTQTQDKLEKDEAFKNIHRKFFDPLEYYTESIGLEVQINKQERVLIDLSGDKIHYFLFNSYLEDFENEIYKIHELIVNEPSKKIVIYSPTKLELTNSILNLSPESNVTIVDYEPYEFFILLVMYKDNYDFQPLLGDIISIYTKQKL